MSYVVSISQSLEMTGGDPRSFVGKNLLHLLNIPSDGQVLIFGTGLEGWKEVFQQSCYHASFVASSSVGSCDLILYHSNCANSSEEFIDHLKQLRKTIAPLTSLLIFAENFYSFTKLKRLLNFLSQRPSRQVRNGYGAFRRAFCRTGYPFLYDFIPMPSLVHAEELIVAGSRLLEVPSYWHPLLRFAHLLGHFRTVADGYIFLCTPWRLEESRVMQAVSSHLNGSDGSPAVLLSIERIDLRLRGAMILFVTEQSYGRRLIVRVVSDPRTCETVRRNQEFLQALRELPKLPDTIRCLLPNPLGEVEHGGSEIFIESMLSGILAWKINRGRLKDTIYQESVEFLLQLNRATRFQAQLEEVALDRLFNDDLLRLDVCLGIDPGLRMQAGKVVSRIRQLLHRRKIPIVLSHGDYGYGNILVEPGSGRLTGVIDWDTGRQFELVGIDLLNLQIQKARTEKNVGVFPAFVDVARTVIGRGGLDESGRYQDEFGIQGDLVWACLGVTLLRYLTRAAQYPQVFAAEQDDYMRALDFLSDVFGQ